jgi:hypothetical protein
MRGRLPTFKSGGGARHALTWKGRKIIFDGVYPSVWWPDHPCARKCGQVRVHRAVVSDWFGRRLLRTEHVHHRDENVWNWKKSNLVVTTNSNHTRMHSSGDMGAVFCDFCGQLYEAPVSLLCRGRHNYCSTSCSDRSREKIRWPSDESLQRMMFGVSLVQLGRKLGVSDNAIRRRARVRGLLVPNTGR